MKTFFIFLTAIVLFSGCSSKLIITEDLETLKTKAAADPNDGIAYYNLGLGYLSEENYPEALINFEKCVEREPEFSAGHFAIYCTKYKINNELFSESLKDDPDSSYRKAIDSVQNHMKCAFLYDPFFNWQLATILTESRSAMYELYTPDLLQLYIHVAFDGFDEFFRGNSQKAIEDFTHTIEFFPQFQQARYFRGLAYAQEKNYDAAISDFDILIDSIQISNKNKILPVYLKSADLFYAVGIAQINKGEIEKAIASFKKVLLQDMSYYMAHVQLSRAYEKQKDFARAVQEMDAAILAAPNNSLLHYNKAVFLSRINKSDQSIAAYKKSIELNKYRYEAYFNLAELQIQKKDYKSALNNYKEFLRYTPQFETNPIAKAKSMIDKLNAAGL